LALGLAVSVHDDRSDRAGSRGSYGRSTQKALCALLHCLSGFQNSKPCSHKTEKAHQPFELPRLRALISCELVIAGKLLAQRIQPHIDRRQSAQCSIRINLRVIRPLSRQFVFSENSFDRTFRDASVAIDTRLGVNHKHVIVEMKGLDRTRNRTICITTIDAWLSDDISHPKRPPSVLLLRRIM
jgi:hypothetical protein